MIRKLLFSPRHSLSTARLPNCYGWARINQIIILGVEVEILFPRNAEVQTAGAQGF